jgi:hypothetical protein
MNRPVCIAFCATDSVFAFFVNENSHPLPIAIAAKRTWQKFIIRHHSTSIKRRPEVVRQKSNQPLYQYLCVIANAHIFLAFNFQDTKQTFASFLEMLSDFIMTWIQQIPFDHSAR